MALVAAERALCAFCFCIAQLALASGAAAQNIAIVISEDTPSYRNVADTVRRLVTQQAPPTVKLFTLPAEGLLVGEREILNADFYSIAIAVGARAAGILADLRVKPPVLNTFIPRSLYERLPQHDTPGRNSAIYLEQPLSRHLELARLLLPGKTRLGFVYGRQSDYYWAELERQGKTKEFSLVAEMVTRSSDLGPALRRIFSHADFLLVLPDAELFNRTTIPKLMLSSYHSRRPVIAFSATLVKSGALAAVFSSPDNLARHIAEVVLKLQSDGKFVLPPPQYPIYWSVSVNRQVANALGLSVAPDQELHATLSRMAEVDR